MVASLLRILGGSGIQDKRLCAPVDTKAFKKVWRKAGLFTTQWQRIDFIDTPDFGRTRHANITLKGEFITRLCLVCNLPDIYTPQADAAVTAAAPQDDIYPSFGWTNSIGHALVQEAAIEIDGSDYDYLNSQLLEVIDEFWTPYEKMKTTNELIGRSESGFNSRSLGRSAAQPVREVFVPLPFWFSRGDAAAALPIDSLANSQVRVRINFRALNGLYYTESRAQNNTSTADGTSLWPMLDSSFYKKTVVGDNIPGLLPPGAGTFVEPVAGVTMPTELHLGDCYLLAEYAYVDKYEAHTFRSSDIKIPIVQHIEIPVVSTKGATDTIVPLRIGNPVKGLYWMAQREECASYNAHFLATRDFKDTGALAYGPWWPDCCGSVVLPGFSTRASEPFKNVSLVYEGKQIRYESETPAIFRSIVPSMECIKAPWINKYYYTMRFGVGGSQYPISIVTGEANMDKIQRIDMRFGFNPIRGTADITVVPSYLVRIWAETYNVMRIYGGRAALMFAN